jgi:GH43 family beta-xylosidase
VYLPADGFGCSEVREAPVTLVRGGKVYLFYSACDTGKPDYKLGLLVADAKSDLMKPASWKQHPTPVFARADENGVFGPGHNFFFQSPDGKEDWIVYHAKTTSAYTYAGRSPRAQPFTWKPDGTPDLGVPRSLDADIPAPSGEPKAPEFGRVDSK